MNEQPKRRGRHKKDCDCVKCLAKRAEKLEQMQRETPEEPKQTEPKRPTPGDIRPDDIFSRWEANRTEDEPEQVEVLEPERSPEQEKTLISGMLLLSMIDAIAPVLFVKVVGLFSPKTKIKPGQLRLTMEEKREMEELAEIVARQMIGNLPPAQLLAATLFLTYTGKVIDNM